MNFWPTHTPPIRCLGSGCRVSLPDHNPQTKRAARAALPRSDRNFAYRFENWKLRRAFFLPYFLRSTTRGSRVRKPSFLSAGRKLRLEVGQRLRRGRGAPRRPGPRGRRRDRDDDVELAVAVRDVQRLLQDHAQHRPGEVLLDRLLVDGDLARAGLDPDAGDRVLALAGRVGAPLGVDLLFVFRRFGSGRRRLPGRDRRETGGSPWLRGSHSCG